MSTAPEPSVPAIAPSTALADVRFRQAKYVIKRSFFSFFNRTFRVYGEDGALVLFVQHPVFKLRGEWQIFSDEAKSEALVRVKAQQVIALNFMYDLTDLTTNHTIGSVRTKGLRSIVRDTIEILNPAGEVVGHLMEKGASIMRRFFPWLTSKHDIEVGGEVVATVRQKFRFFIKEFHVDQTQVVFGDDLDPRLILTCALLAVVMESQRESS